MQILLLGATGRTGKHLLTAALSKGFRVNVLVRDKNKIDFTAAKLKVFEGNAYNIADLKNAIIGCNIVISALNLSRKSDFPWATLRSPKDFLETVTQNILSLSHSQKLEKIITISAWGVAETRPDIPFWFRWLINNSNLKYPYANHEIAEKLLKTSNQNYTIVRPVGLTNATKPHQILTSVFNLPKPNFTISRKMVAEFILGQIDSDLFQNQTVTISAK